jgi:hypothetical protein
MDVGSSTRGPRCKPRWGVSVMDLKPVGKCVADRRVAWSLTLLLICSIIIDRFSIYQLARNPVLV